VIRIDQALFQPRVRLVPLLPEIAAGATQLGSNVPGDPADRMIVASCRHFGVPLVTRDRALQTAGEVETIW